MIDRRFKHWIYLNQKGKELYGKIFPKGEIPVVSMIPTVCQIEGNPVQCYMIYHEELTKEQFEAFLQNISERFKVSTEVVRKHIASGKFEDRIPIRADFVSGAGTNHPGLFI